MAKFLATSFLLLLTSLCWANTDEFPVSRLAGTNEFIFSNSRNAKPGTKLYIYNDDKFGAIGVVRQCKARSCLGKVYRPEENFNYQLGMLVRYSPRPIKRSEGKHGVFGAIGGTLGYGKVLGYVRTINKESQWEVGVESLSTTLGGIGLSGIGVVGGFQFVVAKGGMFDYPSFIYMSYNKSELDFSEIDESGFSLTTTVVTLAVGQSMRMKLGDNLSLSAGLGGCYNTYADAYEDEENKIEYQIPFAGIFLVGMFNLTYLL